MERIERHASFGGWQEVYKHESEVLKCSMNFSIYSPPSESDEKLPVIYWLSGLTCNEQNFITKAGAQKYASEHKVIIVAPDTSPRGESVPDDEAYDLGQGAGFYVNATQEPWSINYKMYDYIVDELRALIDQNFPTNKVQSIMGHSAGGHGALVIGLRNPQIYKSISAFSPIVAPSQVPWGQKAFTAYLGTDQALWSGYDAVELIKVSPVKIPILVDQGSEDSFLKEQLKPEILADVCRDKDYSITLNMRDGYDHSYYFIASFIEDHIKFHLNIMN
ncbi:S-formylglutathione hydrolase [Acinetobacter bereziniae]|uniref:S-formylglutathione hydrolase n=1 Tax=Acinetobacter bereziniae TaxID=106648 RepID=UPI001908ECE6|nr:S-formylglutathione hydrolase [Acinetobacter bereziniae]MDG3556352.1 S-formylglutathione hydrolase [Acinetobacter bereziniae]MDP6000447.1 S-formylglutathione hydrolase [Acinetobacter bereziniae]QQC79832.1 S-formylglutathione hydrolase [Acinetobacter bereziniae]UUN92917.1 S-formylglutathione hydrolase [Acinetobacter bereziniae]WMW73982.1 S-formylglutathione hydrolase [Acinetobacter bereziniae]